MRACESAPVLRAYSPILGIATAAFELGVAAWALARRRRGRPQVVLLAALLLVFLAGYQILEVVICWAGIGPRLLLSRLAFVDVAWLPPLTTLLLAALYGRGRPGAHWLRGFGYLSLLLAGALCVWVVVDYRFVSQTMCEFLFARYRHIGPYFDLYGGFYQASQVSSALFAVLCLVRCPDARDRLAIADLVCGIILYLFPSLVVGIAYHAATAYGLPSIMCHLALVFAIFLARILRRELSARPA